MATWDDATATWNSGTVTWDSNTGGGGVVTQTDSAGLTDAATITAIVPSASPLTLTLRIAFTTDPFSVSPMWTDVTSWLDRSVPVVVERGRDSDNEPVQPGRLSCQLTNDDGRFTPGLATGPYYPNIKARKRVQLLAGTTTIFDGHLDPPASSWWRNKIYARVPLSATDALGLAANRQIRSLYEEEVHADNPVHYWTLADEDGSAFAAEAGGDDAAALQARVKGRTDPDNGGGRLEWGQGTGPGVDGLSAPLFTSGTDSRAGDYRYLTGPLDVVTTSSAPSVSYEVSFRTAVAQSGQWMGILGSAHLPTGTEYAALALNAGTGELVARWAQQVTTGIGVTTREITSVVDVWDGRTHHAVFVITDNFGTSTTTGTLFVDGTQRATATHTGGIHGGLTNCGPIEVGRAAPSGNIRGFDGTLAHVAVFGSTLNATQVGNHYQAWLGWPNQTTDTRIAKLAARWGYHTTSLEVGRSTLDGQPTNGQTMADALNLAALGSEDGLVFVDRSGALRFHNRRHRLNRSATINLTPTNVTPDVTFSRDPATVRNHITVTKRQASDTARSVVVKDTASIAEHGEASETVETVLPKTHLVYRGQTLLAKVAHLVPRVESVTVVNADTTLTSILLQADLGDAVAFTSLGVNAPATSVEFDVDHITHEFTPGRWSCTLKGPPRDTNSYAVVGTGTYSQVGALRVGW